ncbi:MAG: SDR family oxidoreductase [Phycisphaerae bacterium]
MTGANLHVVTGAFGLTGRYITRRLLDGGVRVRTLTGRAPEDSPFGDRVETVPFCFDDPARLTACLRDVAVLYNTYWIRFPRGRTTHDLAVANSRTLIRCAAEAGVGRFVHVSITNPDEDSPLSYFRGKAQVERALAESGLSYAILRPALLFGSGDVLINNIAWMLRRLPVFGVFGRGDYRVQPVHVDELAVLAVEAGAQTDNVTLDAVGPEVFRFEELVRRLRDAVRGRARIVRLPPAVCLAIGRVVGRCVGDVLITREEIDGLMGGLLVSHGLPTCRTRFTDWLQENADSLGRRYANEVVRHYRHAG